MIHAVIDTNVLVSAFITKNPDSPTAKVWSALLNYDIIPIYSEEIIEDPKDVVFYEVALSKDDAYLVTGNTKHFPKKPIVVTPAEMLEILKAANK